MPSPKSGKSLTAVSPMEPKAPDEADKQKPGSDDSDKKPHKAPGSEEEAKLKNSWIEIEMVYESNGKPVPSLPYEITLPDGSVASGSLDEKGFARVEHFEAGACEISFPSLDKEAWEE